MVFQWIVIVSLLISFQSSQYRPPLLYCEEWKETITQNSLNQEDVSNENLILCLYGEGKSELRKSHHEKPEDDPYYVWSGRCNALWAVTLKHSKTADLSKHSRIRWRTKQSGFHELRLIIKSNEGKWYIGNKADGASGDWHVYEFIISDISWYEFDIIRITEGAEVKDPDVSKIVEIGFTDLRNGGDSEACSRVDWIEVYAF